MVEKINLHCVLKQALSCFINFTKTSKTSKKVTNLTKHNDPFCLKSAQLNILNLE